MHTHKITFCLWNLCKLNVYLWKLHLCEEFPYTYDSHKRTLEKYIGKS